MLVLVATLLGLSKPAWAQVTGYALKFDGVSDAVRFSSNLNMIGAGWQTAKTVSLWVKPTGLPFCTGLEPGSCDAIFGDKPRSWGIARGVVGGLDRIWVWNFDGTIDKIGIEYTPGEWVQVALVHGGGMLRAYKNGLPVGAIPSGTTPSIAGQAVLHLGGVISNASSNWTFGGEIDELQLWNIARTDSEISQGGAGPLTGSESGLAAYYKMSDGAGNALTDDSVYAWTGTLTDGGSGVAPDGPIVWQTPGVFAGDPPPFNNPPVAGAQDVITAEDTGVSLTLTGSDADLDPLTFRIVSQPAHGSLSGAPPEVTYTPAANFHGADTFTFVVNDGHVDSPAQTVSVTVTSVNDDPVAANDAVTTKLDTAVEVSVLNNDVDADGDTVSITSVGVPQSGMVTDDGTRITYFPSFGFTGADTFNYTVTDGQGGVSTAVVTVTVTELGENAGYALKFNGVSNFVELSRTSNIMAPGWQSTKTISLWVKPTGLSSCVYPLAPSCRSIFGDRPEWWGISRGPIGTQNKIWVWNYDGGIRTVGIDYTLGEWVHITMVHAAGVLSAYRNGVLVGSVASGDTRQPTMGALPTLTFGGRIMGSTNRTHEGEIDELAIWNTARSAAEITQYLNQPLSGSEDGLAAYYRMSDGTGTTVTDDSNHGWTGTFYDGYQQVPASGPILWVPSGAFTAPEP